MEIKQLIIEQWVGQKRNQERKEKYKQPETKWKQNTITATNTLNATLQEEFIALSAYIKIQNKHK